MANVAYTKGLGREFILIDSVEALHRSGYQLVHAAGQRRRPLGSRTSLLFELTILLAPWLDSAQILQVLVV